MADKEKAAFLEAKLGELRRKNREKERVLEQLAQEKPPGPAKKHARIKSDVLKQELPSERTENDFERRGELTPLFRKKNSEPRRPPNPSLRSSAAASLFGAGEGLLSRRHFPLAARSAAELSIPLHLDSVAGLALHEGMLCSASYDGTCKLWSVQHLKRRGKTRFPPQRVGRLGAAARAVYGLCAVAARQAFLVGDSLGQVTVQPFGADAGFVARVAAGPLYDLVVAPDGGALLGVGAGRLHLFGRGACEPTAEGFRESAVMEQARFVSAAFISETHVVAGTRGCNKLCVLDVVKMAAVGEMRDRAASFDAGQQANKIRFRAETGAVYSAHEDGHLRVFDPRSGAAVRELGLSAAPLNDLRADGPLLAVVGADNALRTLSPRADRVVQERRFRDAKFDCGLLCVAEAGSLGAWLLGGSDGHLKLVREG